MEIITSITFDELSALVEKSVKRAITPPRITTPEPDRIGIDEACKITGLKKATIYRKSFDGTIPCERFGKFLVFSRKKLTNWLQAETVEKLSQEQTAIMRLQSEGRKKL